MIMWKRGVTKRGEFANRALEMERQHRGWWPFSYRILKELEQDYTAADEPLLERLYQSLAAGEGIYKITKRGRFSEFDLELVNRAKTHFKQDEQIVIHDMGVSSGVTSLELYREFQKFFHSIRMIASDYYDRLTLVDVPGRIMPGSRWTVAFDRKGLPIQTTGLGTVFGVKPYPWRYALVRLVQYWVDRFVIPIACQKRLDENSGNVKAVRLFHPEVVQASLSDPSFQLIQHDVFRPYLHPCHIVRAMNVITPRHFSHEQTREAIRSSIQNLKPGGWLVLGRSMDEVDGRLRASVYQMQEGTLRPLWHHQDGYEWPELVDKPQYIIGALA